jgi:hypothetical protein
MLAEGSHELLRAGHVRPHHVGQDPEATFEESRAQHTNSDCQQNDARVQQATVL